MMDSPDLWEARGAWKIPRRPAAALWLRWRMWIVRRIRGSLRARRGRS